RRTSISSEDGQLIPSISGHYAKSVTTGGWERKSIYEPLMNGFLHVHPADCLNCAYGHIYPECSLACANVIDKVIAAEDSKTVSAIVTSPVFISGSGFIVPPMDYFQRLREICNKHNVLLIFDEIITGFGRLGSMFGADYYHVIPDLICCGKGMSGGYSPLASVLIQNHVYSAFLGAADEHKEFHHGHTFGGNPLSAAAGVAVIQQLIEQNLVQNSHKVGMHLTQKLTNISNKYSSIKTVQGMGLLQGFRFTVDASLRSMGLKIGEQARRNGLLLRAGSDFIAVAPPLTTSTSDIDEICQIIDASISAVENSKI
ncbi:aminotransferase class III-fold pyridoxal phosphate-dependent enzyme, partial [Alicyclobacillus tolerans]|uniref:aminotransferase class III-fold pyridoxal phosphate-dependent enzyme n=1 Tax=Alicyclobacillus tolerans TaxID=90970 RepID=UPI001F02BA57